MRSKFSKYIFDLKKSKRNQKFVKREVKQRIKINTRKSIYRRISFIWIPINKVK